MASPEVHADQVNGLPPSPKPHAKPGRKRMGTDVFVPVTMKVEPSELATIEMIAKASKRSRSDVMREMLSSGLRSAMESAFGPGGAGEGPEADAGDGGDAPSGGRTVVSCAMDPDALAVLGALSGDGRGSRSETLRRAIAEGLAVAGGADA